MFHKHYNQRILSARIFLFAILALTIIIFPPRITHAAGLSLGVPFGGRITFVVPPTIFCLLPHFVIVNFYPPGPHTLALFPSPGSIRLYGNFVTPGVSVLGLYSPTPVCVLPYPVFPTIVIGTSSTP